MNASHPALRLGLLMLCTTGLLGQATAFQAQLINSGGDTSDRFAGGAYWVGLPGSTGVAASGDVIVAGCMAADFAGNANQGSAVVFRWSGVSWVEEQVLTTSVGAGGDLFGLSVALCGPVIVVGSPYDSVGGGFEQGSATVFRFNGSSWVEEQTLLASAPQNSDAFGAAVSVSGDVIVVGTPLADPGGTSTQGSATVFRFNGSSWIEDQVLVASAGQAWDTFGSSVSISGHLIAVGARFADIGGKLDTGSVTVFHWNGSSWWEEQTLAPYGGTTGNNFGLSVSVSGDLLVGGAPFAQVGGLSSAGSATVFRRNGSNWWQEQTLTTTVGAAGDQFGTSVTVNGHTIVAGSPWSDVGPNTAQGSATVFRWNGFSWVEEQTLTANDGATQDKFGATVAANQDDVIVGAPDHDVGGKGDQGAAYAFDLPLLPWTHEGSALAGIFGDPLLVGAGDLTSGGVDEADLSLAAPNAPAALFVALSSAYLPFKGGFLRPYPFLPLTFWTTSNTGTLLIPFLMPAGIPPGYEIWIQWGIQDGAAINGVSLSNALKGLTP